VIRKRTLKRTGEAVYDVVVEDRSEGKRKRHVRRGFTTKKAARAGRGGAATEGGAG
jgi:hypothetical protein